MSLFSLVAEYTVEVGRSEVREMMSGPGVHHTNNRRVLRETTANSFISTNVQTTCATVASQQ